MTKQSMYLKMVVSSLMRRRSRMIVALLAVAIGAAVLSGLVTIHYDIPRQMGKAFRSYGANLIFVPVGDAAAMQEAELRRAEEYFPRGGIVGITPYRYETIKINEQPFMIAGTDFGQMKKTRPFMQIIGDWPTEAHQVLVGANVAEIINLSPGDVFAATGTTVGGERFRNELTVSGIVKTGGVEESFVFIKLAELETMLGNSGRIGVVECSIAAAEAELTAIADAIAKNIPSVVPRLVKQVVHSEESVLGKLRALVYLVTTVVLLLTMICVATTMMAVVTERRKEIGLKKALGAENKSIVMEFLGEGLFLGAFGGALGIGCGYFFAQFVSLNVFNSAITFQPLIIPGTLLVSIAVTGVACLIPVKSATYVEPAIVLRGE